MRLVQPVLHVMNDRARGNGCTEGLLLGTTAHLRARYAGTSREMSFSVSGSLLSCGRRRRVVGTLWPVASRAADLGIVPPPTGERKVPRPGNAPSNGALRLLRRRGVPVVKSILGSFFLGHRQTGRQLNGGQTNAREVHIELPEGADARQLAREIQNRLSALNAVESAEAQTAIDSHGRRDRHRYRHHGVDHQRFEQTLYAAG